MSQKKNQQVAASGPAINPWPLAMIAGGLVLIGLVVYAAWQAGSPGAGPTVPVEVEGAPSLKVDKDEVDLGDVRLGQTVEVEFTVYNVGDRQLRFVEKPYVELVEGC